MRSPVHFDRRGGTRQAYSGACSLVTMVIGLGVFAASILPFGPMPVFADSCSMKAHDTGGAYTVPPGVTLVRITAYGHAGEPAIAHDSAAGDLKVVRRGGAGTQVVAIVPVSPGDVLQPVTIAGGLPGAGGDRFPGTTSSGRIKYGLYGTFGGAAEGVVRLETGCRRVLVVAGGGGGNGSEVFEDYLYPQAKTSAEDTDRGQSSTGGHGDLGPGAGATEGEAGHHGRNDGEDGAGGGPGVTNPPTGGFSGAAGHTPGLCPNGNPGQAGGFESAGAGGDGPADNGSCDPRHGGGGGGGGYYGGGGGGSHTVNGGAGAGGGGSSYVMPTATNVTYAAYDGNTDSRPFKDNTPDVSIEPLYTGVTITITGSPNPGLVNQPVTYTATVTADHMMPADLPQVPTGTITFLENLFSIGTVNLVNGVATFTKTYTGGATTVSIRAIYSSDGLFLSNVSDPSGYTERIFLEPEAPAIGTHPTDTTVGYGDGCLFNNGVIVTCNDNAVFTATATGVPGPTVQWQALPKNGFTYVDIPGATNTILSLKPAVAASGNLYRAVFTNGYGTATTTPARLTVNRAPLVISANDTIMAFHGTVPTAFDVTYGKPSIGAVLRNGDTPSSLTGIVNCMTTATSASSSGNYPITCSGLSSPNYTITYEGGTLVVADAAQTIHISTTAPTHAFVGDTYTPVATGGNSGNPVVFTIDPDSTPGVCSVSAGVVSFLSAGPNGIGFCFIDANQAGNAFYPAATQVQQVAIVYNVPPAITKQPVSQTVASGQEVTFTSAGTGSGLWIQWQESTDGAPFDAVIGQTGADLTLTATLAMNGYRYRVTYTNATGPVTVQGVVSDVVTLTVYAAPATATATSSPTQTSNPPTPTPTNSPTQTPTSSPTSTPTSSPTQTPTSTPTSTATSTPTATATATPTTTATPTYTATPTVPPPKSLVCYGITAPRQSFAAHTVQIADAAGTTRGHVTRPQWLCSPANVDDADPHAPTALGAVTGYPVETRQRYRSTHTVRNLYGTQTLKVDGPGSVLLPATQQLSGVPAPAGVPPVDHFACYRAHATESASRHGPRQTVTLQDLFGSSTATLGRPTRLCLPADINGTSPGAESHADALLCYSLQPVAAMRVGRVFVTDDLGTAILLPRVRKELCVPSVRQ